MNADDRALIDRFLDMLAAEAGAARNTLLAYRTDLEGSAALIDGSLAEATSGSLSLAGIGPRFGRRRLLASPLRCGDSMRSWLRMDFGSMIRLRGFPARR